MKKVVPPCTGEGGVLQQEVNTHSLGVQKTILESNVPHCKNLWRLH